MFSCHLSIDIDVLDKDLAIPHASHRRLSLGFTTTPDGIFPNIQLHRPHRVFRSGPWAPFLLVQRSIADSRSHTRNQYIHRLPCASQPAAPVRLSPFPSSGYHRKSNNSPPTAVFACRRSHHWIGSTQPLEFWPPTTMD